MRLFLLLIVVCVIIGSSLYYIAVLLGRTAVIDSQSKTPREVELENKVRALESKLDVEGAKTRAWQVDPDVRALVRDGRKIEAIKLVRERYGLGLKDAKDAVESIEAERQ